MIGKRNSGNALMEYAVPMGLILVAAGVLVTVTKVDETIADYFMAATGHTSNSLSGSKMKTEELAKASEGSALGNGNAFTNFGSITDGNGMAVSGAGSSGGYYGGGGGGYSGAVDRSGSRPAVAGTGGVENLYPIQGRGPIYQLYENLPANAPAEYRARVLNMAATAEYIGNSGSANVAPLIGQQDGLVGYIAQHPGEVAGTGEGIRGAGVVIDVSNAMIDTGSSLGAQQGNASGGPDAIALNATSERWDQFMGEGANVQRACVGAGGSTCGGYSQLEETVGQAQYAAAMWGASAEGMDQAALAGQIVANMGSEAFAGAAAFTEFMYTSGGGTGGFAGATRTAAEAEWDAGAAAAACAAVRRDAPARPQQPLLRNRLMVLANLDDAIFI